MSIPQAWLHTPKVETYNDLISQRRKNTIPDPSYDLDCDGVVGAHDLVLASKFDFDKDGKLNSQERENALKAISQGYANQFVWGCESSGLNRSFRLIQKRGKVIVNEDFWKVRETYPDLPTDKKKSTKSQLENKRKDEAKEEAKKNEKRLNTVTNREISLDNFLCKEHYVESPAYSSIKEKREIEKKNARVRAGLSYEPKDLKDNDIAFSYNQKPQNTSFSDMKSTRKAEIIKQLNRTADLNHQTFYDKIENQKQYTGIKGRNIKDSINERRKFDVDHFEKIFGNYALGIHGKELPKYELNTQKLLNHDYPITNSQGENYDNPFINYNKEYHKIIHKKDEITKKPTQISHEIININNKSKVNSKFSTFHSNFMPNSVKLQETYHERLKLIKGKNYEKKKFKLFNNYDTTPPITQRLLLKNYSPGSKFKSITSTGFSR
ncbi:hypothetical protein SteCoe_8015 [Stentor coeruleus]|uniref:EF-hand domain-containing protein n=1 Tax=Stentor coeruleus TaxID=5963 RepID=A0A1R2CL53_9CILI|nr:hypothetical protein SteCoe_8015 [Stentor coeruleus]